MQCTAAPANYPAANPTVSQQAPSPDCCNAAAIFKLSAVGYFSPIGGSAHPESGNHPLDRHLRLVHDAFELHSDVKSMFGVAEDEAVRLLASGKRSELIDRIYASYAAYKDMHDVVLVQGSSIGSGKLDAEIAGAINAPAIIACQVCGCT